MTIPSLLRDKGMLLRNKGMLLLLGGYISICQIAISSQRLLVVKNWRNYYYKMFIINNLYHIFNIINLSL